MKWKNIYRGFLMGTSDIIPGVSAGTIAVLLGIYNSLLAAINGFFSKEWKKHLGFLIPLGVGVISAILLLSHLLESLLENYQEPTHLFFLGLILGILPFLVFQADVKNNFTSRHYILLIVAAIAIASMVFLDQNTSQWQVIGMKEIVLLFLSGWVASMAMLLPGISGSFILLIFGVYATVLGGVNDLNLIILIPVALGVMLGFISMSKLLNYLMSAHTSIMYALIIGMVTGSLAVVYKGFSSNILLCLLTFTLGFIIAILLGNLEYKK
ncbi:DUF368 domain-containing protein [Bacillus carboniphilus]|uniref:DUF368 domain-containing protein n=1 Tax=Bacillus carboniphilus TaxID=86663 RepID=A0ABY9K039_9BACI|nr:DUF368 domain-containing protein [Bacillus carboniphilus]WLR44177.1 DUF368 domain-containing protein [Bacillus carboniphilus]